jgi:hypothetical protein
MGGNKNAPLAETAINESFLYKKSAKNCVTE